MPSTRQETPIEFVGSTSAQAGVPAAGNRLVFADSADSAKLKIKKSDATLISLEDPAAPAAGSITYAQIQDVSATDKVLGRSTAGAGDIEEIPCTAAGRALLDDVAASDQRTTLGLGALAVKSTVIAGDFGAGAIVNADINAAAAIALSKLASDPLARANHTGTQLAATISDFDSAADARINLRTAKSAVRAATPAPGTLASSFENGDVIDGITLATGDRILLKSQTTTSENGIYTVNASGAPTRATDADISAEVIPGMAVHVREGTANADTTWVLTTDAPITLDTTGLTFVRSGANAATLGGQSGSYYLARANHSGTQSLATLSTDPLARANHTGTQLASTVSDFTAAVLLVAEHALVMGLAGAIPAATTNDVADFYVPVPFNMTLKRIITTAKTAPTATLTVQIRRSTDGGSSFADAFGTVSHGASVKRATGDPADLNVNENDVLNFSITGGGGNGANLLVAVIGIAR